VPALVAGWIEVSGDALAGRDHIGVAGERLIHVGLSLDFTLEMVAGDRLG
jgi:hypothetical protein